MGEKLEEGSLIEDKTLEGADVVSGSEEKLMAHPLIEEHIDERLKVELLTDSMEQCFQKQLLCLI